jgi:hypothetical protein
VPLPEKYLPLIPIQHGRVRRLARFGMPMVVLDSTMKFVLVDPHTLLIPET